MIAELALRSTERLPAPLRAEVLAVGTPRCGRCPSRRCSTDSIILLPQERLGLDVGDEEVVTVGAKIGATRKR